jgi:hypothetical protein
VIQQILAGLAAGLIVLALCGVCLTAVYNAFFGQSKVEALVEDVPTATKRPAVRDNTIRGSGPNDGYEVQSS